MSSHEDDGLLIIDIPMTSAVIVNWNSGPLLERCVRSLLKFAEGCRIIVVDNASTDSSLRFPLQVPHKVTILRNSRNLGFASACNIGWRASRSAQILFLNPDTECLSGSIRRLEQTLEMDKTIWAAGGQLLTPNGTPQTGFNLRPFPTVASVAAEMLLIEKVWRSNPWSGKNHRPAGDLERDVDQPAAACLMVSRTALEEIEGFDESFQPAWFEDVDLCRRIRSKGGRIRYQPEARFLHQGGYSLEHLTRQDFLRIYHSNQIRYFKKHHGTRAASQVRKLVVAGLLFRSALAIAWPILPNRSRTEGSKTYWRAARFILNETES